MGALDKVKSIKGIILIVCLVLAAIGMIFIWIGDFTGEAEDWCAIFTLVIVILNCCVFFFDLSVVGPVAGVMELAMINFHFSQPHRHAIAHNEILPVLGYVLMIIGSLVSFIAFPLQIGKPQIDAKSKSGIITIVMIVAAILLVIGNIFFWIDEKWLGHTIYVQPIFLAVMFIAGNLWGLQTAVDLSYYASGLLLHAYWSIMVTSDRFAITLGGILIVIALFAIIILYIMSQASGDNKSSSNEIKAKFIQKDIIAILVVVCFILVVVGCVLVWASNGTSAAEDWCSIFSLSIVILNAIIYFMGKYELATISGCLGYGIWNTLSFIDLLFTWPHLKDHADCCGAAIAGYALQIVGVILSYAVFKGAVALSKPNFGDKFNIIVVIWAVLLIVGNVFLWIGHGGDVFDFIAGEGYGPQAIFVSPILLAILYLCGHLFGLTIAIDLCFFIPAYIIHGWWSNMVAWSKASAVIGAILINIALIGMIVLHVIKMGVVGSKK